MRLAQNWRRNLLLSYTVWAFYTLAALTIAPDLIYLGAGIDTNPAVWSILSLVTIILGLFGRFVIQTQEGRWRRRSVVGLIILVTAFFALPALAQTTERQTMEVATPLVMKWEGENRCSDDPALNCAYRDIVGVPTICFGETKDVKIGDRATDAECRAMLTRRLANDYRAGLHRYFTDETRRTRLTPERDAAYVSLAYNVGIRGAGRSTATRRLNAGNIAGGCNALTWWNKAGGRVVRGLVRRRADEYRLCMEGLG